MTLSEALNKLLEIDNYENLSNSQIYSILSDYGVFKENPKYRLIIKSALEYNFWSLFIESNNCNDFNLLKIRLINDGYDSNSITEILKILSNNIIKKQSDNKILDIEVEIKRENNIINSSDYSNNISFLGLELGHSINDFDTMMKNEKFIFINKVVKEDWYNYNIYKGKFAYIEDCRIYIYFNPITLQVYKIIINSKNIGKINKTYELMQNLYDVKYGKNQTSKDLAGNIIYRYNENNLVELKLRTHIYIRYLNLNLFQEADQILQNYKTRKFQERKEKEREDFSNNLNII